MDATRTERYSQVTRGIGHQTGANKFIGWAHGFMDTLARVSKESDALGDRQRGQVDPERVRLLYTQAPIGQAASVFVAVMVVWFNWTLVPHALLIGWLVALGLATAGRALLTRHFVSAKPRDEETTRWLIWFIGGIALSGLVWGSIGFLFTPYCPVEGQVLLALILSGLSIGATSVLGPVFRAYATFTITAMFPIAAWFYSQDTAFYFFSGSMMLILVMALQLTAYNFSRSLEKTIRLANRNFRLTDAISQSDASAKRQEQLLSEASQSARTADQQYLSIFEQNPIAIWIADWSGVSQCIDELRRQGTTDFQTLFEHDRNLVADISYQCHIVSVNPVALAMYQAPDFASLLAFNEQDFTSEDEFVSFRDILLALTRGEHVCVTEGWEKTCEGGDVYFRVRTSLRPDSAGDWAWVMHTCEDLTELKSAEQLVLASEQRLHMAMEVTRTIVFEWHPKTGRINYVGDPHSRGVPLADLPQDYEEFLALIHPDDRAKVRHAGQDLTDQATQFEVEFRFLRASGEWAWLLERGTVVERDENGKVNCVIAIDFDISARKRVEEGIQVSELRYRELFEQAPISLWEENWSKAKPLLDGVQETGVEGYARFFRDDPQFTANIARHTDVLDVNAATLSLYHAPNKSAFRPRADQDFVTESEYFAYCDVLTAFASGETRVTVECWEKTFDGKQILIRDTVYIPEAYRDTWGLVIHAVEDITEAHHLSTQLSYESTHDDLTGLPNRAALERRLQRVMADTNMANTEHALCYIDLDQFKIINDTIGHAAGDQLLLELKECLQGLVRKLDTLVRLGGDEFGILMEQCSLGEAERAAGDLVKAITKFRFKWQGHNYQIGASIGLMPISHTSGGTAEVLSGAETACYAAKEQGRNHIQVYRADDASLTARQGHMQLVRSIGAALDEGRFRLTFQPIAMSETGAQAEGKHYELLIRMLDDDDTVISAGEFLPTAEKYNLAPAIDRWVIATAFEWLAAEPMRLSELGTCAINLSGQSLVHEDFADYIIRLLTTFDIPPEKICFEITETAAIANLTSARRLMEALKELGCRFALDDFGRGLSSFAYLKTLPVDVLKIDGLFVAGMVDDPVDMAMVKSINDIGQVLGKQTVAEFVEDQATLDALRVMGVDYVQGYFIGRPSPLSEC